MSEEACPGCGVNVGEIHYQHCDIARCLWTGHQLLQCEHGLLALAYRTLVENGHYQLASALEKSYGFDINHRCGHDRWTGEWPGISDCRRLNLWAKMIPGKGWVTTTADDPEAHEDLNSLYIKCRWDRNLQEFVLR